MSSSNNLQVLIDLHPDDHQNHSNDPKVHDEEEDYEVPRPKPKVVLQEKQHDDDMQVCLGLKIEIPSSYVEEKLDDENDGFKTPTSSENKIIPMILPPPPPRKRKGGCCSHRTQIVHDHLSEEIESFFSTALINAVNQNYKKPKLFTNS